MNKHTFDVAMVLCYNLAIIAGTVYLVEFYDWSPWWFLLTIICLLSFKTKED